MGKPPAHWLSWRGTDASDWSSFCLVHGGHRTEQPLVARASNETVPLVIQKMGQSSELRSVAGSLASMGRHEAGSVQSTGINHLGFRQLGCR